VDFFARKIGRLRPGLNPRSCVPEASLLTTRPPKPLLLDCTVPYSPSLSESPVVTLLSYCFRAVRGAVDHGPQYCTARIFRWQSHILRDGRYIAISDIWCVGCAYSGNSGHDGGIVCLSSLPSTALVRTAMAGSSSMIFRQMN
jgi:hypothetical protein